MIDIYVLNHLRSKFRVVKRALTYTRVLNTGLRQHKEGVMLKRKVIQLKAWRHESGDRANPLELEYSEEELRGVEKSNVTENAFLVNWSCIRHEFGSICLPSRKSTGHGGFGEKAHTCDLNMIVSYGSFETRNHSFPADDEMLSFTEVTRHIAETNR